MGKVIYIFLFFLLYSILYPLIIWNLPVIQSSTLSNKLNMEQGADLNIRVSDSVSYSITHNYLGVTLPVYVNGIEVRLFDKLWVFSVLASIILFLYILFKYIYGFEKSERNF